MIVRLRVVRRSIGVAEVWGIERDGDVTLETKLGELRTRMALIAPSRMPRVVIVATPLKWSPAVSASGLEFEPILAFDPLSECYGRISDAATALAIHYDRQAVEMPLRVTP